MIHTGVDGIPVEGMVGMARGIVVADGGVVGGAVVEQLTHERKAPSAHPREPPISAVTIMNEPPVLPRQPTSTTNALALTQSYVTPQQFMQP